MRLRVVFAALALAASVTAYGQELNPSFRSESKAATFMETKGSIIKIDCPFSETISGWSSTLTIEPCVVTNVRSEASERFVRFTGGYNGANYTSALDEDEIPALLEALDYISNETSSGKPSHYMEYKFRSRDGLEVGVYWGATPMKGGYGWIVFVAHGKYLLKPSVSFEKGKRLGQIRETVAKAQTALTAE